MVRPPASSHLIYQRCLSSAQRCIHPVTIDQASRPHQATLASTVRSLHAASSLSFASQSGHSINQSHEDGHQSHQQRGGGRTTCNATQLNSLRRDDDDTTPPLSLHQPAAPPPASGRGDALLRTRSSFTWTWASTLAASHPRSQALPAALHLRSRYHWASHQDTTSHYTT